MKQTIKYKKITIVRHKPPVGVVLGLAVGTPDVGFEEGFAKLYENSLNKIT